MTASRPLLVVQITRGMAPAVSIAGAVTACMTHASLERPIDYKLIQGLPAAEAKNEAARLAVEREMDLLLIEDDILAPSEMWAAVAARECQGAVAIGTALMRNGELNTWFHGTRVCYSGTVFLYAPLLVLRSIGNPWFEARDFAFCDAPPEDGSGPGHWIDKGPNPDGLHSDVFFFKRLWDLGIKVDVLGSVTHLIHEYNNQRPRLCEPNTIKPLGIVTARKLSAGSLALTTQPKGEPHHV